MSYVALRRTVAVTASVALVFSALGASPAEARKKKKCPVYTSTGAGKDAELSRVTPKATEKKPVEATLKAAEGLPEVHVTHVYQNVQVTKVPAGKGLYVRLEFPQRRDLDLYLLDATDEQLARAAGFNPLPEGPFNDTSEGGHSETNAEQIDAFAAAACDGFTVDAASYLFEGGEVTLKFWLGKPPAEEEE